jgi:putative endonuclease
VVKNTDQVGRTAERIAAAFLMLKGYRILARRFRGPVGEVDIVAIYGFGGRRTLVFVEVKARKEMSAAAQSISTRQKARIRKAADAFVQQHPDLSGVQMRFDAILVAGRTLPRHVIGAWVD